MQETFGGYRRIVPTHDPSLARRSALTVVGGKMARERAASALTSVLSTAINMRCSMRPG